MHSSFSRTHAIASGLVAVVFLLVSIMAIRGWGSGLPAPIAAVGTPPPPVSPTVKVAPAANLSSAIDAGIDLRSAGVTDDFDGVSRPQGRGFDIGAYEFIPTAAPARMLAAPASAVAASYYVATDGNDGNPGTQSAPWRTLQHAFDQRERGAIPAGAAVQVRGGTYREPVVSAAQNLTVEAAPGEQVILDLSMDLTGPWTAVGNGVYRTTFTRRPNPVGRAYPGVARVATTVNTQAGPNERLAYLLVDDVWDEQHWLKPVADGRDYRGETQLPAGSFATDAPDPSVVKDFGGMKSTLWVRLPDGSNPAEHRVRVGAYSNYFYLEGAADITIRGFVMQLAEGNGFYGAFERLTLERNELRLTKNQPLNLWKFTSGHTIRDNWFHHNEYENIHNEASNSLFENNRFEDTLARWSDYGAVGINTLGSYNVIRGNTVRGMRVSQSGNAGFGFITEQWYTIAGYESGVGNLYERNLVEGNEAEGFYISGGDGNIIRNNVVANNGGIGIAVVQSSGPGGDNSFADGARVFQNTIYNNGWKIDHGSGVLFKGSRNAQAVNNILWGNRRGLITEAGVTASTNLETDPRFVDAGAGNFRLQGSSPAVNTGSHLAAAGVTDDFTGSSRLAKPRYDIGAYAFLTSARTAGERFFPETGQVVRGAFLAYWEANGGLALYGLPLSEEQQAPLEDGALGTVQWFERARFELRPGAAAPADVTLSRLGLALRPADPPVAPLRGQRYFDQTGHNVGGAFLRFWESNGGVTQFGLPITDEVTETLEDGRRYTVQWFERARFEYHPEHAAPYDLLLGQLGRDLYANSQAFSALSPTRVLRPASAVVLPRGRHGPGPLQGSLVLVGDCELRGRYSRHDW